MRNLEVVIMSDLHLGSYGCQPIPIANYLNSINPKMLILNGDIVDIWRFRKNYFPETHIEIINIILKKIKNGTTVYYLTGNHDEALRKFSDFNLENFHLVDKLKIKINGDTYWIFHGDVFDSFNKGWTKLIAKTGSIGYDLLILLNRVINTILVKMGKSRRSFSKKIKNSVKSAIKWITDFELTAAELAIENEFDYVICGHIHAPCIKKIENEAGSTIYMNSGDWVENLTALEYQQNSWKIYRYLEHQSEFEISDIQPELVPKAVKISFKKDIASLAAQLNLYTKFF